MGLSFGPSDYHSTSMVFSLSIYIYKYVYMYICATVGVEINIAHLNSCSLRAARIQRSDLGALNIIYTYIYTYIYIERERLSASGYW